MKRFDESAPLVPLQARRRSNGVLLLTVGGLTAGGLLIAALVARTSGKKQVQRVPRPSSEPPTAPKTTPDVPPESPPLSRTPVRVSATESPFIRVTPPPPAPEPPRQTRTPGASVIFAPHVVFSGWGAETESPLLGDLWPQPEPPIPPMSTGNTGIVGPAVEKATPLTNDAAPGDPLVPDLQPAQYTDAWLRAYTEGYAYGKKLKPAEAHRKIVSLAFFQGQRAGALGLVSAPPAAGPDRKDYLDGYALGRETDKAQWLEIVRGEASAMGSFDAVRGLTPRTEPAHARV